MANRVLRWSLCAAGCRDHLEPPDPGSLILNAADHLDSDLAVDGLTLHRRRAAATGDGTTRDALYGHSAQSVLVSLRRRSGVRLRRHSSAVERSRSGSCSSVASTLAWRVSAGVAAVGGLVPLIFSSLGTIWLSGRITGGHLLTLVWHTAGVRGCTTSWIARGDGHCDRAGPLVRAGCLPRLHVRSSRSLGCSWAGVSGAMRVQRLDPGRGLALIVAFLVGAAPRVIGQWVEPHDAYHEQFTWSLDTRLLADHSEILFCDCLPRLVAGHRLPGLEADPDPAPSGHGSPIQRKAAGRDGWHCGSGCLCCSRSGTLQVPSSRWFAPGGRATQSASATVAAGLAGTVAAVVTAFLINRNIFNSDNYRYLVLLLVPWPLGSGLVLRNSFCRSATARLVVCAVAILLSALYTSDRRGMVSSPRLAR